MPQLAVAAAGSWLGSTAITGTVLGMTGAQLGWMAGSLLGSLLFAPDGPKAQMGDTRAPKIDFGARMTRVYGTVRVPLNPRWIDEFTAASQSAGGKGGGGGSKFYTYSTNALYWAADGTNVKGFRKIWKNGELVYNNGAGAPAATLAANANSEHWSDITFFNGGPTQLPWSVYEAVVGSANADAHRRVACIGIQNAECGSGTQLPFYEAEVYTNGSTVGALTLLQSRFKDTDGDNNPDAIDESWYQHGSPTQDGGSVVNGAFVVDRDNAASPHTPSFLNYQPVGLVPNGVGALTFECFITRTASPNVSYITAAEIVTNINLPAETYQRFGLFGPSGSIIYASAGAGNFSGTETSAHCAIVFSATSLRVYIAGQIVSEQLGNYIQPALRMRVRIGDPNGYSSGVTSFTVSGFRVRQEEVYTGNSFTPPTLIPAPDSGTVNVLPVDLADVVSSECLRCRGVSAADFDVTELVGTQVYGLKCEGSARDAIEQLMAAYYFTAVPGPVVKFIKLDKPSLITIPAADTGIGLDEASETFAGLMRANDLELPAQVSITGPNPSADHDPATATSDRLTTVGNKIEQATWNVVFTPAEMKGRANANAIDARIATHTATIHVSDKYAAYEIGDVVTHVDEEGNSYVTRWLRENYSQGVKSVDVRLFDRSILTLTGTMSNTYTPAITVRVPSEIQTALLLDSPILRDADDSYGLYVTATATGRWQGATVYKSSDGAAYSEVAQLANRGVIGSASVLPNFTGWTWDNASSLTVTLDEGSGSALTSSTKTAIEADPSINAALVGVHGRWEAINYVTATLVSGTTYTLTGFLRGQKGTEQNNGTHAAGDKFVLLRTVGVARVAGVAGDIGSTRYYKIVPAGSVLANVAAITFTTAEQGLKPYAPVDIRADRQSSGDIKITFNRRSRLAYSPLATTQPPLGEASEAYSIQVWTSGFGVFKRTLTATAPSITYTAGQQEADFGGAATTYAIKIAQVSATVGDGRFAEKEMNTPAGFFFTPLASNNYPDARLANGTRFLFTRNGLTKMGLYQWEVGASEAELIGTVSADNSFRYLQGYHMHAKNGDKWVMYLRGYTNRAAERKLVCGDLSAKTFSVVAPVFMAADPPIAIGYAGGKFIAITVAGGVFHSLDDGANWTNAGTVSGITLPPSAADFNTGRMFMVGSTLAMAWAGSLFYAATTGGLSWSAATGDVVSDLATYTAGYAVVGFASKGSIACAVAAAVGSGSTQLAIVYTSTDGQAWTRRVTDYSLGLVTTSSLVTMSAVGEFAGNFFVAAPLGAPESGSVNRQVLGTWGGATVYWSPEANRIAIGSTRLISLQAPAYDTFAASNTGDVFNEQINWS